MCMCIMYMYIGSCIVVLLHSLSSIYMCYSGLTLVLHVYQCTCTCLHVQMYMYIVKHPTPSLPPQSMIHVCMYMYVYIHTKYVIIQQFAEWVQVYPSPSSLSTAIFEPLGGVFIGTGDSAKLKPALFVVSCGEGHLDLRTADKVSMYMYTYNVYTLVRWKVEVSSWPSTLEESSWQWEEPNDNSARLGHCCPVYHCIQQFTWLMLQGRWSIHELLDWNLNALAILCKDPHFYPS